jgi:CrcB protein
MSFGLFLVVMVGGALGSLARYVIALWAAPVSQSLPLGTMGINILGSFIIGFFGTLTLAHGRFPVAENIRIFVMVGFCGGFTTFSSFSLQTLDLMRKGAMANALVNVVASVVLCITAVAAGHLLASQLNGGRQAIVQAAIEEEA